MMPDSQSGELFTELKRAEEASRRAYAELSAHLAHTPLAVLEWDRDAKIRRWSGLAESMFGWTAAEVLGRSIYDFRFIHEEDVARVGAIVGELVRQAVPGNVCRNRNYHKSGRVVHCLWHNSIHLEADGRLGSVLSLAQDLTEQVGIQEELTLSEERLRTALRFAGMLSWDYDVRRAAISYSQDVREFFHAPDLAPGADLDYGVAHPDDRARIRGEVELAREVRSDFRIEYRGVNPDAEGRSRWYATRGSFVVTSAGDIVRVLGVTADVTEPKRIEHVRAGLDNELREARHLESLGLLAGGIAHDFNNLLTIILGNAGVVKMLVGPDESLDKSLGEIETACQRAADLCSQITAYAGVGRMLATEFDFNELLRESEESFRVSMGSAIPLALRLDSAPCPVVGESRQLRQAIGNVLVNAAEAMENRVGEIELATSRAYFEAAPDGFSPPISPGDYLLVRVADTGCGMPEADRARAFDAFFSTKFAGRGLGLAAVYGIVRSHQGSVRIRSRVGEGTAVELLLPSPTDARMHPELSAAVPHISQNILVVDDDANIRELICSVLEDDGYTVFAAANGLDAETLFDRDPLGFRLAVVDLMMPGISGHELIRRMRVKVDAFPALIVSGYAEREMTPELMRSGPTMVLPKPFRLEQLSAAVKSIIS